MGVFLFLILILFVILAMFNFLNTSQINYIYDLFVLSKCRDIKNYVIFLSSTN